MSLQIVSSDIVGMRFGSLFDATQTMVNELPNGVTGWDALKAKRRLL